jgi:CBS domain-containing protein
VDNYRNLKKSLGESIALKAIVKQNLLYQKENIPVHEWTDVSPDIINPQKSGPSVNHVMTQDIVSVNENVSLELAKSIFDWNDIHHLPVENADGDLVGLITDGMIERLKESDEVNNYLAKDIMLKNVISTRPQDKIVEALNIMDANNLSGLPVTYEKKLIGIFTKTDLKKLGNKYPEITAPKSVI